jgi:DMSO/TMAO reductase YedYZ molybdopterin-dependent catalytic subunit
MKSPTKVGHDVGQGSPRTSPTTAASMTSRDGSGSSELVEQGAESRRPEHPEKGPNNSQTPFNQLGEFITPLELVYLRSHFPIPKLDPPAFRLSIRGAVGTSYADLRAMPLWKCVATRECGANSRVFRAPPAPSTQWELGAVGNAEWTRVPRSVLFERARRANSVCDIVLEGAGRGHFVKRLNSRMRGS